ncbi:alpha/beta fold hydrolase [Sulfurovum sp.]|uniref:alpha/beta hydrolase n=1 Tax=Sulfurovum sp. TaxID=1969726 RepID=UPI0025D02AA0|nr:alpha/beta fold hydrolase [Sulfurovum sp.]
MKYLLFLFTITSLLTAQDYKKITFPSKDGLPISAYLYSDANRSKPFILLLHQAGYSKGEYLEIAPALERMGFNVMAVDLRSGGTVNNVPNETSDMALKKGLDTSYLATIPDIEASLAYSKKHLSQGKLILWGSSYSAGLALYIAGMDNDIAGVLAFSPGEYYKKRGKKFIEEHVRKLDIPIFITSAKNEKKYWWNIYKAIPSQGKTYYLPHSKGVHGAKALWKKNPSHEGYWKAVKDFLQQFIQN